LVLIKIVQAAIFFDVWLLDRF